VSAFGIDYGCVMDAVMDGLFKVVVAIIVCTITYVVVHSYSNPRRAEVQRAKRGGMHRFEWEMAQAYGKWKLTGPEDRWHNSVRWDSGYCTLMWLCGCSVLVEPEALYVNPLLRDADHNDRADIPSSDDEGGVAEKKGRRRVPRRKKTIVPAEVLKTACHVAPEPEKVETHTEAVPKDEMMNKELKKKLKVARARLREAEEEEGPEKDVKLWKALAALERYNSDYYKRMDRIDKKRRVDEERRIEPG